jgi:hypothetical protein
MKSTCSFAHGGNWIGNPQLAMQTLGGIPCDAIVTHPHRYYAYLPTQRKI